MESTASAKAALNIWCSKKKLKIDYLFTNETIPFHCEVHIQSINTIVGEGDGQNKKLASQQAALNAMHFLINKKYITETELSQSCYSMLKIKELLFSDSAKNINNNKQNKSNDNIQNQNISIKNNNNSMPTRTINPGGQSFRQLPRPNYRNHSNNFRKPYSRGGFQNNDSRFPPISDHCNRFQPPPNQFDTRFPPPPNHPNDYEIRNSPSVQYSEPGMNRNNWPRFPAPPTMDYENSLPNYNFKRYPHSYNSNPNQRFHSQDQMNKFKNNRNRKEYDNNVYKMENLNISDKMPINYPDIDDSMQHKEVKKCRLDTDSARNKLELIKNECNFNLDNSKQQLNIFFQVNKVKADYEYSSFGPAHLKTFIATMKFYVHRNKKEYFAEEKGNSKQDASRWCALNILHQLYKDNMITSFEPEAPSKRQLLKMSFVYDVKIDKTLKDYLAQVYFYVRDMNNFNMKIGKINMPETDFIKHNSNFLYWCPPLENFNPWTNTNLDGTSYAGKTKADINTNLKEDFLNMVKSQKFQKVLAARMKLPIWEHKEEVIKLIESNPVVIIKGSTGCGKTTQVSQFILDSYIKAGNGANCNIIVTQPRRISAISIAERVAFERCEELRDGKYSVGYSVRFDHIYPRPYGSILFCTTGHLLRRIQGGLKGVSHLIIDEVHERDINTDLLLIIIRDLIKLDLNIHVIIMSATLGVSHFQKYFDCSNVLEIDSHVFPVQRYYLEDTIEMIKWRPRTLSYLEDDVEIMESDNDIDNTNQFDYPKSISQNTIDLLKELKEGVICYELILSLLEYIDSLTITGSILIFLPGWNSIFALLNYLKRHHIFGNESKFLLLPLHSQLSNKDNNRIFQHSVQRKIILSTNIAETSITIDDVVFVIDTCLIKRKLYSSSTNVTSFLVDWVSQSNIQQRQGRAGRVRSGYFFVLCTKKRFNMLEEFKKPEILVSSLVETALLVKYLGFGSVVKFLEKALDPPSSKSVEEACKTLRTINAFDANDELTSLGKILAKLPIDPRIGRMIMESILLNVAGPITTIAAASSINFELFVTTDLNLLLQTLFQLDEERYSDHIIAFKAFNSLNLPGQSYNSYPCINYNSISVVQNARRQLVSILIGCGFNDQIFNNNKYSCTSNEFDIIAGLLITAFYPNVCIHKDTRRILTNEERIGLIHKTSVFYSYVYNHKLPKTTKLKSPLFVYSEKSQNKNLISSKQMTMVSFLHLLLFGVKRFVGLANDIILLDGWIEIKIDPEILEYIIELKTGFEQLLTCVCSNAEYRKNETDNIILTAIEKLCLFENVTVDIILK